MDLNSHDWYYKFNNREISAIEVGVMYPNFKEFNHCHEL